MEQVWKVVEGVSITSSRARFFEGEEEEEVVEEEASKDIIIIIKKGMKNGFFLE
jgi:hypothetical protein